MIIDNDAVLAVLACLILNLVTLYVFHRMNRPDRVTKEVRLELRACSADVIESIAEVQAQVESLRVAIARSRADQAAWAKQAVTQVAGQAPTADPQEAYMQQSADYRQLGDLSFLKPEDLLLLSKHGWVLQREPVNLSEPEGRQMWSVLDWKMQKVIPSGLSLPGLLEELRIKVGA